MVHTGRDSCKVGWHTRQEGRQDRQEGCQANSQQGQGYCKAEQEISCHKFRSRQLVRPRQAQVPRYADACIMHNEALSRKTHDGVHVCPSTKSDKFIAQDPSPSPLHTCLASLLETMAGTQLVCQLTQPPSRSTGTSRLFTPDGPCLVL